MKNFIVAALSCFLLIGCNQQQAKFHNGQIVEFVVSGQRAQIIGTYTCSHVCFYDVRVFANQTVTKTHIFGADSPMETYAPAVVQSVREYELRAAE